MSVQTYGMAFATKGYKTATAGTVVSHDINGRSGGRISILSFAASCGETATSLYFMQTLGATTISADVASGLTTVVLTADCSPSGNTMATADVVCILLDNGTYQFNTIGTFTTTTKTAVLGTALAGAVSAGQPFFDLGIYSDTGHVPYKLTASAQTANDSDIGVVFGAGTGYPMRVYHPNPAVTTASSIDNVAIAYINK